MLGGRGAVHCVALSPRRIALRSRIAMRGVTEHRADNPVVGFAFRLCYQESEMVGHFVLHAYRSWNADNPNGYVKRGNRGIFAPDEQLARVRNRLATQPPVIWDEPYQYLILALVREVCAKEIWRLHGIAVTPTHVHAVASTRQTVELIAVQHRMKQQLGKRLSERAGKKGKRWLSRGGIPTRVKDSKHLHYLLKQYLPQQGGLYWCEGMAEPRRNQPLD